MRVTAASSEIIACLQCTDEPDVLPYDMPTHLLPAHKRLLSLYYYFELQLQHCKMQLHRAQDTGERKKILDKVIALFKKRQAFEKFYAAYRGS